LVELVYQDVYTETARRPEADHCQKR